MKGRGALLVTEEEEAHRPWKRVGEEFTRETGWSGAREFISCSCRSTLRRENVPWMASARVWGGIIFGLGLFKSAEETRRKGGGGGGGWRGRGNESNELPRQIFSASLLSQRNRLRCDFVVVARDYADAQSFSRAPFSNSTYQSGTFPSPSVNFMNTRSSSLSFSFLSSLRESQRFVEFSIRRESHCAYLLAVLLIDGLVAEREEVEKMREE